jgi:hypothetical protein
MRTTIDIDADILATAEKMARRRHMDINQFISSLIQQGMERATDDSAAECQDIGGVGGFRPFPARGAAVTNELVEQLRSDDGI